MEPRKQTPEQICEEALQFTDPQKRAVFLKEAIGNDEQSLRRVELLLQAHENAGKFLAGVLTRSSAETLRVGSSGAEIITEKSANRIGRYKLLQQIGEGGCGVVYMAEQEEPVRRRVALKVIKLGMDTKQVVGRFEAERQALALMDHPNIAKVLDAGATETGRPYFVMELVRGIKITDYCDQNNLSTEERLKLFIQVCQAIQHAHQKGIIHRDIKPSNVLVTLHDGVPVPKVIDFGIAKATTDQRLTDKTVFTAFEQFIGTPAYMSPEQAEMSGLDIDTRTDIYSLGVLLYELLTSRTPFDPATLLRAGLDQMRRIIREQEPPRPSTKLTTLDAADLLTIARHRHAEAPRLVSLIRGDLDWIVMKSIEKDRTRRYDTAGGLALDLQRHLRSEPVVARPPSQTYRFQKLFLRHRAAIVTVLVAVLAALAALIVGMRISRTPATDGHISSRVDSPSPADPVVPPTGLVSGVVLAKDTGQPLPDARVCIAAPSVDMRSTRSGGAMLCEGRTDQNGRFKIQVPKAETISLDAFFPGYESAAGTYMGGPEVWMVDLPFPSNQLQEFTIKLRPALYVAGLVVDEAGAPFPGADVEATIQETNAMAYVADTRSDTNGRFQIFDFPLNSTDGSRGELTFNHPTMVKSDISDVYLLSDPDRKNLRIVLRRGHDIRGIVTTSIGRPATGTLVEALPADPNAQYKQQTTDAEGRFLLQGLPNGEMTVRTHSFALEQKARVSVRMAGSDLEVNLHLAPVQLKNPLHASTLFGMKLTDLSPELRTAYDLKKSAGVLIVDPGKDYQRLGIGSPEEGNYFWLVGSKDITNLREMVHEILRINEIPRPSTNDWIEDGYHGYIRVVNSGQHGSFTSYLRLTDGDTAELKALALALEKESVK